MAANCIHPQSITLSRTASADLTTYAGYACKYVTAIPKVVQSTTSEQTEGIIGEVVDDAVGSAVTVITGGLGYALAGTGNVTVDTFQTQAANGLTDTTTKGKFTPTFAFETRVAGEFYLALVCPARRIGTYA